MLWAILFFFGLAIGSFLNVVILRYDGEKFLFEAKALGGRSHCMHCGKTLRWFELVPVVSFLVQGGRCRHCGARLSAQYPAVELLSALIFTFVPFAIFGGEAASAAGASVLASLPAALIVIAALWVAAFELLLVMAAVDIRMGIIPDEINILLGVIGIALMIAAAGYAGSSANHSFLGPYAAIFGMQSDILVNRLFAAIVAGAFFGLLILVTRGRGMGMGDLKLAVPLGLVFGWPDIAAVIMFAFVIGAVTGLFSIARGKKTMKGTLPFGPFLAIAAGAIFYWGPAIFAWYFSFLK
jgi:prepilin signal peptidase PulO-like enzyme (type II secretory pathway)